METNLKQQIREYIMDNFQYDPGLNKSLKNTLKIVKETKSFESIIFRKIKK